METTCPAFIFSNPMLFSSSGKLPPVSLSLSLSHTCTHVISMHVEITTTGTHTYTHMHTNIALSALKKVREF